MNENQWNRADKRSVPYAAANIYMPQQQPLSDTERILQALDKLSNRISVLENNHVRQQTTYPDRPAHQPLPPRDNRPPGPPLSHATGSNSVLPLIPGLTNDNIPRRPEPPRKSSNPGFIQMTRSLYKTVQIRRHMDNWQDLPRSISKDLNHLADLIKPTDPTDSLRNDVLQIFNNTGNALRTRVQQHFLERLDTNRRILSRLDARDMTMAIETVRIQISRNAGKKLSGATLQTLLEEESAYIGKEQETETTGKQAQRDCAQKTPMAPTITTPSAPKRNVPPPPPPMMPTTSTSNYYAPLATTTDMEEDEAIPDTDVEELQTTPTSPPRKKTCQRQSLTADESAAASQTPNAEANLAALADLINTTEATTGPPVVQTDQIQTVKQNTTTSTRTFHYTQTGVKYIKDTASMMKSRGETWRVCVDANTKTLVIGDSNLRLVETDDLPPNWQLTVLPGARLDDLPDILVKLPYAKLTNLIISVGINNRTDPSNSPKLELMERIANQLQRKAKNAFTMGVSYTPHLPPHEQDKLMFINRTLASLSGVRYICPLRSEDTVTLMQKNIHYNKTTVSKIWSKIITASTSPPSSSTYVPTKN